MAQMTNTTYRPGLPPLATGLPAMPPLPPLPAVPGRTTFAATTYTPAATGTTASQVYTPNTSGPDSLMAIVSTVTPFTAGAAPGFRVARQVNISAQLRAAARNGRSVRATAARLGVANPAENLIAGSLWSAVKTSLIFKGLSSLAINGYKLYSGLETKADAGSNVVGDLVSAGVGGIAAGLASGITASLLVGVMGPGLGLGIVGAVVGAAAFFVADSVLQQSAIYNSMKASIHAALS